MSNSLLELEKSLGPRPRRPKRKARARKRAPLTAPPAATAPPLTAAPSAPSNPPPGLQPQLARASQAVDYRVPGIVQAIAQPSGMTCWATVATIMVMWKKQQSMTIPTALQAAGASYVTKFNGNQGLLGSEKAAFLSAMGLAYQLPQSRAPWGWESLLRSYGPLWITTDEDPTAGFAIHARVMAGIHGDGTPTGTTIDVIDPAGGRTYSERFDTFLRKYESEALTPGRPVRIQIVHWPTTAGLGVLGLVRGKSASYAESLSAGRHATVIDDEFEPTDAEQDSGVPVARAASAYANGLKAPRPLTAADVRWPADASAPDYRHLGVAIDTTPFDLTARVLKRLAAFNRFAFDGVDQRVVIGLRGCTLDNDVTDWSDAIRVREAVPNHADNRCVIGVWDRVTGKVVAFSASTVPNWEYMEAYRQNHARRANQQPTGRYSLVVGTHRPGKKSRVLGALRNASELVVLRTQDNLSYTVMDTWDQTTPFNNIHPGLVPVNQGTSTVPDYSSAGCSTVPGTSSGDVPSGAWAAFRKALGLDNASLSKDDGRKFAYMLLTGREARLCAGSPPSIERLRFGSQGEDVRKLQDGLASHPKKYYKGKVDGDLGAGTAMAFIRFQKDRDRGAADGIVTPGDATALGFALGASGAQQMDIIDKIVEKGEDIARGIFNKLTKRAEEGRFAVTGEIAEFMHDDTASSRQWTRKTAELKLKATAPRSGVKDVARLDIAGAKTYHFKLLIDFEYNGYDIKNAQISRVIQGSSEMTSGQFTADFKAKNATTLKAEVARIEFVLSGKWDPGLGDKYYDFKGKVFVEADGDVGFSLDKNERVSIDFVAGATLANVKTTSGKPPANQVVRTVVFFEKVGSDVIAEKEMSRVKSWLRRLRTEQDVRYKRLRAGTLPINIEGYASATGKGEMNQKLSRSRAEKVQKLFRDELGSEAKIILAAHGEDDPAYKDSKKDENDFDRRVDIWFEVTGTN
ncbi:MAG: OmpA family protein [Gemmatimonadaceae bacterium]|nr:OmpA family protein [Gemmatimonadaceae bacterium]